MPIREGAYIANTSFLEFDLRKIITDADYVFAGTVVDRREYEVEWNDDSGEQWGPFSASVIDVKVNKEYHGKSPVESEIVRIYYPYSLSVIFGGSFLIKQDDDYVFITRNLDDDFVERKKAQASEDKFEQEKYADVYISDPRYSLMSIDNGIVFMYHDYFIWNNEVTQLTKSGDSLITDKVASSDLIEPGWFNALDIKDFDNAFSKLFESPEKLPNLSDLKELHKTKSDN